jgi:hypothetical protein
MTHELRVYVELGLNVVVKFLLVPISVTKSFHKSAVNLVFLVEIIDFGIPKCRKIVS